MLCSPGADQTLNTASKNFTIVESSGPFLLMAWVLLMQERGLAAL
jgi:hypothetical protein